MTLLAQLLAQLCTVLGVVSATAVLVRARDVRLAVTVLLQFLLAAGLLRLSGDLTWRALLTVAVVVLLRRVVVAGLREPHRDR